MDNALSAESQNKSLALDFTSTTAFKRTVAKKGRKLQHSADLKRAKYAQFAIQNNCQFIPLVMNNFGAIHEEFSTFINGVGGVALAKNLYIPCVDRHFATKWKHRFSALLLKQHVEDILLLTQRLLAL